MSYTKDKYDDMLEQFRCYYPYLHDQMVDWWPSGRSSITVKLEDDVLMEFDVFSNTARTIHTKNYTEDPVNLRKEIGHNIRKVIQTRGLSQADIAERCGITEAMLSRYLHGTSMPGLDKVHALAAVLDCRVIDIIGESYEERGELHD